MKRNENEFEITAHGMHNGQPHDLTFDVRNTLLGTKEFDGVSPDDPVLLARSRQIVADHELISASLERQRLGPPQTSMIGRIATIFTRSSTR